MMRARVASLLLVLVVLTGLSDAGGGSSGFHIHRERHPHADRHHVPKTRAEGGGVLKDDKLLQDRDHIREDLAGSLTDEQINKMDDKELEFQYFKAHDFDKNYRLDGLELMAALAHVIQHGDHDDDDRLDAQQLKLVEELIDDVLYDGDRNNDGYLNYVEYKQGRQKAAGQQ
ncbi:multiple coagulation factor deficiency protein 2 homolog [Hyalella azteca]|uniref:Multiple coagulation factor deficiency protein 2 homolog n=1 Tax=Hyalella azteca TaxID=294128 RepID=A0A8B7N623_HYAAZ|nr:multiple coagulation factor deficiency protein 2 homolog [Hyalella azteca]